MRALFLKVSHKVAPQLVPFLVRKKEKKITRLDKCEEKFL